MNGDSKGQSVKMMNGNGGVMKANGVDNKEFRRYTSPAKRLRDKLQKPQVIEPQGLVDSVATFIIDNQIRLSLIILGSIHAAHYVLPSSPSSPSIPEQIINLSYRNSATGMYQKGLGDFYHVFYWIIVFTLLRDAAMQYVFMPFAKHRGLTTYKGLVRFAEQAWLMVYYIAFWTVGMYINYNSKYWMNLQEMWTDWPVLEVTGLFKWYYLAQLAFWLQQIFVLHIEDRRKDHYQMFAHHIITSLLIIGSYLYHMTRVGNVVLCAMDIVDILLPAAKLLRYLGYQKLCDVAFGIFLITWIISRHVVYLFILRSTYLDLGRHVVYGCRNLRTGEYIPPDTKSILTSHFLGSDSEWVCFTYTLNMVFVTLLALLQVITLIWLYMIGKVAYKVVTGTGAEDTRSDDEGDEEEDEEDEEEAQEEDSGFEDDVKPMTILDGDISEKLIYASGSAAATGTAALSALIMNGNGHSTHRHIPSEVNEGSL